MITLSPSQQAIIDAFPTFLMSNATEMTISGFAGSGKTFLIQHMADTLEQQQKLVNLLDSATPISKVWYTATTNKAAFAINELTKKNGGITIHSLLGLVVQNNYKTGNVELIQTDKGKCLDDSLIFIDEASMIGRALLHEIRKAVKKYDNCKVVFIGDKYQLPPVKEDVCPVFTNPKNNLELSEIQRQVAGNPIIQLSAKYRECLNDHNLDWPEIVPDGKHIIVHEDKMAYFKAIRDAYTLKFKPSDTRIMAWTNDRVQAYNTWIRKFLGFGEGIQTGEFLISNKPIFKGSIVRIPTDSTVLVEDVIPATEHDGGIVTLGMRVTVRRPFTKNSMQVFQPSNWQESKDLMQRYAKAKDWRKYFTIKDAWGDFRPLYASTVHKAQGSTYDTVFVDLNDITRNNKWRDVARLVYVAITRARNTVHIYGNLKNTYNRKPVVDLMEAFKRAQD